MIITSNCVPTSFCMQSSKKVYARKSQFLAANSNFFYNTCTV